MRRLRGFVRRAIPPRRALGAVIVLLALLGLGAIPEVRRWLNHNQGVTTAAAFLAAAVVVWYTYRMTKATVDMAAVAQMQRLDAMTPLIAFALAERIEDRRFTVRLLNVGSGPALDVSVNWRSVWKGEWRADEPAISMQPFTQFVALGAGKEAPLSLRIEDRPEQIFREVRIASESLSDSPQVGAIIVLGTLRVHYRSLYHRSGHAFAQIAVRRLHQPHPGGEVETISVLYLSEQRIEPPEPRQRC